MTWKIDNPQCNESKKIVWEVAPYLRGRGLDIGAGDFKILPHAISVDNMNHTQFGFNVKPDVLCDASKLDVFASQSMDFVYSSHTLEHIEDYRAALIEWWRVVRPGGNLILYLPHAQFYPNIGQEGANPDHKHDFLPADVVDAMKNVPGGWDLIECQERNEDQEYSMLLVFKKLNSKAQLYSYREPKPSKSCCVVRYGAFGDLMQASSVLAGLKKQGYHVTLFSSLPGASVVENNPNIDRLVLFDKDQVPNQNLSDFWGWHKKKYDKWVNLSESVEGTLLALPGRTIHFYPPKVRERLTSFNYVEFQHQLAEIPYELNVEFFPTKEEKHKARQVRERMGSGPVILWSLAGSSVHKTWPYLDNILACILVTYPSAHVVLTGGPEGVILESGWEKEARIHKTSGKWSIRETLSFLPYTNLIVGPETGVLNAAACLNVPKIIFLSHSTHTNLSRDWKNVTPLISYHTECKGRGNNQALACHQLHYGWDHCTKDAVTSTAQCQADIQPEVVWEEISRILG